MQPLKCPDKERAKERQEKNMKKKRFAKRTETSLRGLLVKVTRGHLDKQRTTCYRVHLKSYMGQGTQMKTSNSIATRVDASQVTASVVLAGMFFPMFLLGMTFLRMDLQHLFTDMFIFFGFLSFVFGPLDISLVSTFYFPTFWTLLCLFFRIGPQAGWIQRLRNDKIL